MFVPPTAKLEPASWTIRYKRPWRGWHFPTSVRHHVTAQLMCAERKEGKHSVSAFKLDGDERERPTAVGGIQWVREIGTMYGTHRQRNVRRRRPAR